MSANIPVFNFNSGTTPQTVPLFATDNTAAAAKAADEIGTLLNGTGKIALLEFVPGSATNDQRVDGFKQELAAKFPNIQIVADQANGSDSAKALSQTQNILSAHPDIRASTLPTSRVVKAQSRPSALPRWGGRSTSFLSIPRTPWSRTFRMGSLTLWWFRIRLRWVLTVSKRWWIKSATG